MKEYSPLAKQHGWFVLRRSIRRCLIGSCSIPWRRWYRLVVLFEGLLLFGHHWYRGRRCRLMRCEVCYQWSKCWGSFRRVCRGRWTIREYLLNFRPLRIGRIRFRSKCFDRYITRNIVLIGRWSLFFLLWALRLIRHRLHMRMPNRSRKNLGFLHRLQHFLLSSLRKLGFLVMVLLLHLLVLCSLPAHLVRTLEAALIICQFDQLGNYFPLNRVARGQDLQFIPFFSKIFVVEFILPLDFNSFFHTISWSEWKKFPLQFISLENTMWE